MCAVTGRLPQPRRAHDELAVLHALEAENVAGQVTQLGGLPAQGLDLEAEAVVEVHVQRREDPRLVMVAGLDEPFAEIPLAVIVNEGEGADDLVVPVRLLLDEPSPHEVAHRLRSVPEVPPLEKSVEAPEETRVDRQAHALERNVAVAVHVPPWDNRAGDHARPAVAGALGPAPGRCRSARAALTWALEGRRQADSQRAWRGGVGVDVVHPGAAARPASVTGSSSRCPPPSRRTG